MAKRHDDQQGGNYIGGDPSQGRYAMASDPGAPPEPPMSTTGKSYYENNHWTGESTDPRAWPGNVRGKPTNDNQKKKR